MADDQTTVPEIVPYGEPDPIYILRAAIHSALGCLSNNDPVEAENILLGCGMQPALSHNDHLLA